MLRRLIVGDLESSSSRGNRVDLSKHSNPLNSSARTRAVGAVHANVAMSTVRTTCPGLLGGKESPLLALVVLCTFEG